MVNGCDKSLKSLWTTKYRPKTVKEKAPGVGAVEMRLIGEDGKTIHY